MTTVIVEIKGGVVQTVYAPKGTHVIILDWDDINEEGGNAVLYPINKFSDMPPETKEQVDKAVH